MVLGKKGWKRRSWQEAKQQARIAGGSEVREVSWTGAIVDQTEAGTEQGNLQYCSGTEGVLFVTPGMTAQGLPLSVLVQAERRMGCWMILLHLLRTYPKWALEHVAVAGWNQRKVQPGR